MGYMSTWLALLRHKPRRISALMWFVNQLASFFNIMPELIEIWNTKLVVIVPCPLSRRLRPLVVKWHFWGWRATAGFAVLKAQSQAEAIVSFSLTMGQLGGGRERDGRLATQRDSCPTGPVVHFGSLPSMWRFRQSTGPASNWPYSRSSIISWNYSSPETFPTFLEKNRGIAHDPHQRCHHCPNAYSAQLAKTPLLTGFPGVTHCTSIAHLSFPPGCSLFRIAF